MVSPDLPEREELDDDNNIISQLLKKLDCPRTTYYIYDHQNIIAEYDQNNKQTATYIHGPNIDEPLAADINNTRIYYHADGLGSITTLTNHMGHKVQTYDYDSFGNIKSTPFWIKQPFTYTGREYDSETGLYYYRARYYDPKVGRFITRDPIGFAGGDVNLYNYVGANPVNWSDPSGLITWEDIATKSNCVVDCIKKCPDYHVFQVRMNTCKGIQANCATICFGIPHPGGRALCEMVTKGFNYGCKTWAASVLADDLYLCNKDCNAKKDCDNDTQ